MGMPISVEIKTQNAKLFSVIYDYFDYVDKKFSTYKPNSEISQINSGKLKIENASADMRLIFQLSEQTKKDTLGFFDIYNGKIYDPSGIVKGWAIHKAAEILRTNDVSDFYIDAGGDIQTSGTVWTIGIRNPFDRKSIVKKVKIKNLGLATSGTYERGWHVYNPKTRLGVKDIVSLTVIGPNIYEADRMATAAFAMGHHGINFIDSLNDFAGMVIDQNGIATYSRSFDQYVY